MVPIIGLMLLAATTNLAASGAIKLGALNVAPGSVITAGLGDSADFAHQFHIAFSRTVSGACIFSGQVCTDVCMRVCVHVCVWTCVCICVCVGGGGYWNNSPLI
jgi:hypothetical protein